MSDDLSIVDFADKANPDPLSPGRDIYGYRINTVLGQGDYWFTYLANDLTLGRAAIITEYMPSEIAIRDPRGVIHAASAEHDAEYHAGLDGFRTDAKTLTTIRHHNIVQFLDSFDANNSAYLIVAHEHGKNLEQLFDSSNMEEGELLAIMSPILDGIEEIHARGYIHRYIQPSNIIVRTDGRPVLTGFKPGAGALFKPTSTATKHFPSGFAPIELHYGDSELQGAWTDIYSLGATLYQALVGVAPADALKRCGEIVQNRADPLMSAPEVGQGHYSNAFLKAIDHALCFFPTQRPLTVAAWRTEFAEKDSIDAVPTRKKTRPSVERRPKETSASTLTKPKPLRSADGPLDTVLINHRARKSADAAEGRTASTPPREEMPGQRRGHWRGYSVFITGLVATGLFLWWMVPGPMAQLYDAGRAAAVEWLLRSPLPEEENKALPDPTVQTPAIEQPTADSAAHAGTAEESAVRGRGLEQQINSLLRKAKADVEAGRITHPQGRNAIEKYRAVLALKPDLAEPTQAIHDLLERFLSAARDALDGEQWDAAQSKLDEAAMIAPASTRVAYLRDALNVRKSAALMQHVTEETRRLQAEEVVNKLIALGRKALDANDMKIAEAHLAQALVILPESVQVTALRDEVNRRKLSAQEALKSRAAERTNEEERTVKKLLDLARKAIDEHELQTAQIYVDQAVGMRPNSSDVALVRDELESHRAQPSIEENEGQSSPPTSRQNSEKPADAVQLTIQEAAPSRFRVQPGDTVRFYTEYSLTLPARDMHAYVQATWVLLKNGRRIGHEGMDYGFAKPGRNTAATELPLPSWTKSGQYTVEHRVQVGGSFDVARSHFVVIR